MIRRLDEKRTTTGTYALEWPNYSSRNWMFFVPLQMLCRVFRNKQITMSPYLFQKRCSGEQGWGYWMVPVMKPTLFLVERAFMADLFFNVLRFSPLKDICKENLTRWLEGGMKRGWHGGTGGSNGLNATAKFEFSLFLYISVRGNIEMNDSKKEDLQSRRTEMFMLEYIYWYPNSNMKNFSP